MRCCHSARLERAARIASSVLARENYVDLTGLEVGPPSLEDAYLALTQGTREGELSHV